MIMLKIKQVNKISSENILKSGSEAFAIIYINQGKLKYTEDYINKAVQFKEMKFGKSNASLIIPLYIKGHIEMLKGNISNADIYINQGMAIAENFYGKKSLKYAEGESYLNKLFMNIGFYEKAEIAITNAIKIKGEISFALLKY